MTPFQGPEQPLDPQPDRFGRESLAQGAKAHQGLIETHTIHLLGCSVRLLRPSDFSVLPVRGSTTLNWASSGQDLHIALAGHQQDPKYSLAMIGALPAWKIKRHCGEVNDHLSFPILNAPPGKPQHRTFITGSLPGEVCGLMVPTVDIAKMTSLVAVNGNWFSYETTVFGRAAHPEDDIEVFDQWHEGFEVNEIPRG